METKNNKNEKQPVKGNHNNNNNNSKGNKINIPEAGNGDNWGEDPEKKKEIGDDPAGTERKIPRMKS